MLKLINDILFLILEELQDDGNSLHSCLLVNRNWCELIIPILWKNPWKYLKMKKMLILFDVILSHLSNETRENLNNQGINLFSIIQPKPLFNYINFCKYLVAYRIEEIAHSIKNIEKSKIPIIRDEIFKLFINENTRFTHLYIPLEFHHQIHLIPGAEHCFSELNFIQCSININNSIFERLAEITKSIKTLILVVDKNSSIIELIKTQKSLNHVQLYYTNPRSKTYCKALEESLIDHADTIQYLKIDKEPITKFLSHLVNLISLELTTIHDTNWSYLENVSLPVLRILKAQLVPSKILASLIEHTKGYITEINVEAEGTDDKGRLVHAIYQNCLNLKYLKLSFVKSNILELEKILIHCQHLDGLVTKTDNWNYLFEVLTKSSPNGLFKFKFFVNFYEPQQLEPLKTFFDNWKGRHPMLLQIIPQNAVSNAMYLDLVENYKVEGIVKKYSIDLYGNIFDDFEWTTKKKF